MFDIIKVFVSKNKISGFKKNESGDWVKFNPSAITDWNFKIYGLEDKSLDGTPFRFVEDIAKEVEGLSFLTTLILSIGNPIVEQLFKSSAKNMLVDILNATKKKSIKGILREYFGEIDLNKKSIYQKLGVNKYQFEKIVELFSNSENHFCHSILYYTSKNALKIIKRCLTPVKDINCKYEIEYEDKFIDISSMDNNTFDEICDILFSCPKPNPWFKEFPLKQYALEIASKVTAVYDSKSAIKVLINFKKAADLIDRDALYQSTGYYVDYLLMVNQISVVQKDATKKFTPFFDIKNCYNSIKSMHDLVMELRQEIKYECLKKEFEKSIEKLDKWIFKDEEFSVVKPIKPIDLTQEGIALHHCVGGYIKSVASGYTNILFIRKISEPDKPFFTVEITNEGTIRQIHGACNCNVEKNSDLENFIKKWTKQCKLKA